MLVHSMLDTLHMTLTVHLDYHYMVLNFANPLALIEPVWSLFFHTLLITSTNFVIRSLFVRRIWILTKGRRLRLIIAVPIMALSMADLVSAFFITAKAFQLPNLLQLYRLAVYAYISFISATIADLALTVALWYILRSSSTGFKPTDSAISILIKYIVNTCGIVTLCAFVSMSLYIAMPETFVFMGFYLLLSKLYINCYLASMNARDDIRRTMNSTQEHISIHLTDVSRGRVSTLDATTGTLSPGLEKGPRVSSQLSVTVHTLVDRHVDQAHVESGFQK
ncbi:hypothetical protein CC2G_012065 [Coprinopsis cinerea AmutBmut pab1-1]|nr:hypothetical protein CC2G_012065 [Coprinopsis cinerea AmutBmut pab1-1]